MKFFNFFFFILFFNISYANYYCSGEICAEIDIDDIVDEVKSYGFDLAQEAVDDFKGEIDRKIDDIKEIAVEYLIDNTDITDPLNDAIDMAIDDEDIKSKIDTKIDDNLLNLDLDIDDKLDNKLNDKIDNLDLNNKADNMIEKKVDRVDLDVKVTNAVDKVVDKLDADIDQKLTDKINDKVINATAEVEALTAAFSKKIDGIVYDVKNNSVSITQKFNTINASWNDLSSKFKAFNFLKKELINSEYLSYKKHTDEKLLTINNLSKYFNDNVKNQENNVNVSKEAFDKKLVTKNKEIDNSVADFKSNLESNIKIDTGDLNSSLSSNSSKLENNTSSLDDLKNSIDDNNDKDITINNKVSVDTSRLEKIQETAHAKTDEFRKHQKTFWSKLLGDETKDKDKSLGFFTDFKKVFDGLNPTFATNKSDCPTFTIGTAGFFPDLNLNSHCQILEGDIKSTVEYLFLAFYSILAFRVVFSA